MFHSPMGSVKCRAVPASGEVLRGVWALVSWALLGTPAGQGVTAAPAAAAQASVLPERVETDGEEAREAGPVLQPEPVLVLQLRVGDEGDGLAGAAEWLRVAGADAEQLDAVRRRAFVALGDDEVEAGEEAARDIGQRQLAVQPGDEREALRRGDGVGVGTGLAVPPGVLARMVDLEAVRVVLDGADAQAEPHEFWDDLFDQGR